LSVVAIAYAAGAFAPRWWPTSAASAAVAPASFCDAGPAIVPGARLGRVALGMAEQDARALLDSAGPPPTVVGGPPPNIEEVQYRSGPNAGVWYIAVAASITAAVLLYRDSEIACFAPPGIHLGTLAAAASMAYGAAPNSYQLPKRGGAYGVYNARGLALIVGPDALGQAVVRGIEIFQPGTFCQLRAQLKQVAPTAFQCADLTPPLT